VEVCNVGSAVGYRDGLVGILVVSSVGGEVEDRVGSSVNSSVGKFVGTSVGLAENSAAATDGEFVG
jgi:hypothetical protein